MDLPELVRDKICGYLSPRDLLRASHASLVWRRNVARESIWRIACLNLPLAHISESSASCLPSCPTMRAFIEYRRKLHMWRTKSYNIKQIDCRDDYVTCVHLDEKRGVLFMMATNTVTIADVLKEGMPKKTLPLDTPKKYIHMSVYPDRGYLCLREAFSVELRVYDHSRVRNIPHNSLFDEVFPIKVPSYNVPPGPYINTDHDILCSCIDAKNGRLLHVYELSSGKLSTSVQLASSWSACSCIEVKQKKIFLVDYVRNDTLLKILCLTLSGMQKFYVQLCTNSILTMLRIGALNNTNLFVQSKSEQADGTQTYRIDSFDLESGSHCGSYCTPEMVSSRPSLLCINEFVLLWQDNIDTSTREISSKMSIFDENLKLKSNLLIENKRTSRALNIPMYAVDDFAFVCCNSVLYLIHVKPSGDSVLANVLSLPFPCSQISFSWLAISVLENRSRRNCRVAVLLPQEQVAQ